MIRLGLDIGSNSVGSAWINDEDLGETHAGTSIFPAGVDESDDKRGDPKNAKRRMRRRTRVTLARRSQRKRELRRELVKAGLLPKDEAEFKILLESTDPWDLRRKALDQAVSPHEFGRILLHLSQRRGALGLKLPDADDTDADDTDADDTDADDTDAAASDEGKVKTAIMEVDANMRARNARTFGEFIAMIRAERITPITTEDRRPANLRKGPREFRAAIRNKAGDYEHCADRKMIREEFSKLWNAQRKFGGPTARLLTDELRLILDNEAGDSIWRHKGLLFGQRRQSWDLGTLGRCVLEPTERCVPHADMYASRYLVVETVNNLKIIERGKEARALTPQEREKIKNYLSGPLGVQTGGKQKGQPKRKVTVSDLRELMGWGKTSKTAEFRFNIENDPDRTINTDWFRREIIHGAITPQKWSSMAESAKEGLNRAILKYDPAEEKDWDDLKTLVMKDWAGLTETQADALVAAWKKRPKPDAKRLNMSRRAVQKLLPYMNEAFVRADRKDDEPIEWWWLKDRDFDPTQHRWPTQIEARKILAALPNATTLAATSKSPSDEAIRQPKCQPTLSDQEAVSLGQALATDALTRRAFIQAMLAKGFQPDGHAMSDYFRVLREWERARGFGKIDPLDQPQRVHTSTVRRYATGAKGATARDRYYMRKHILLKNCKPVIGPDGKPMSEPPPAPLISNPVVRKAIHEVRRHLVEYMTTFRRKPDEIYVELSREARMGKMDADRALFRNRLRKRISDEITEHFGLANRSPSQQRAAVQRVILAVQQGCVCPLCGKRFLDDQCGGISLQNAANGIGCEIAHIIPNGSGGNNGWTNIVLAHKKCNQDMGRRTPRQFWNDTLPGGFDEGIQWVEQIYGEINRIKPSEVKSTTGQELWKCYLTEQARPKRGSTSPFPPNYFTRSIDHAIIEQFKKDITDIKEMTNRQDAATKYAARQVMAYLSDALYDGKGLPERGGGGTEDKRKIFAVDGLWTKRFRDEWGLYFDTHGAKAKDLDDANDKTKIAEKHHRKEKNRGDHRHHAIDAIVIALCDRSLQIKWEEREKRAEVDGINTADEVQMENYRRNNPLPVPNPFKSRDKLREAVRRAVFGNGEIKPICHRPVKRKLIGHLHKETLYGPTFDSWVRDGVKHRRLVRNRVTVRQELIGKDPTDFLKPSHLRMPEPETDKQAIERLTRRLQIGKHGLTESEARKQARELVKSNAFTRKMVDPSPNKGGIVRDLGLRRLLRRRLEERGLNPDSYSKADLKRTIKERGPITHDSGVPIRRVKLLWANNDPIEIRRDCFDYATASRRKSDDPSTLRIYDSQNNHHIEIRAKQDKKGKDIWDGTIVPAFEAAQRKLAKLKAMRAAGIPPLSKFRKLPPADQQKFRPTLREIESAHPLVDRRDDDAKGGRFVMSLCEGEMLHMKHKFRDEIGYFVVAKLDKPRSIVLVPHWDARAAGERKDADGKKVPDSKREQFSVTPADLKALAPPDHPHAMKVRVSPLGAITYLERD